VASIGDVFDRLIYIIMEKNTIHTYDSVQTISSKQLERIYALSPFFGEDASKVVNLLSYSGRGPNSYAKVYDKTVTVNKARGVLKEYYSALTEDLKRFDILTVEQIVGSVSETRANLDMIPYVSRIKTSSLSDFFKLFIFEEVHDDAEDGGKGDLVGYRPLFSLFTH
jgi:hypothetical protein